MTLSRPFVCTYVLFVSFAVETVMAQDKSQGSVARDLRSPVRIIAGGQPIDVTVGHAAPYVMDVDGDGVRDLLVGEFGEEGFASERLPEAVAKKWGTFDEGKLRIYRNVGTNDAPKFESFRYMEAGGEDASIPTT